MRNNEIIICGLTDYENQIIKEHKGECKYCMYNDSYFDRNEHVQFCSKRSRRLDKEETDCKDWLLDTR